MTVTNHPQTRAPRTLMQRREAFNFIPVTGMLLTVVAILYASLNRNPEVDQFLLVCVVSAFLSFFGLIVIRREVSQGNILSPLTIFAVATLVHFTLFAILQCSSAYRFVNPDNYGTLAAATGFTLLCFGAYWVGYRAVDTYLLPNRRRGPATKQDALHKTPALQLTIAALLMLCVGWTARAFTVAQGAYFKYSYATADIASGDRGPTALFSALPDASAAIFIILYLTQGRKFFAAAAAVAVIFANAAYWGFAGMKQEFIASFFMAFGAWYFVSRKLPSPSLIVGVAIALLSYLTVTSTYRAAQEARDVARARSLGDIVALATDLLNQPVQSHGTHSAFERLNLTETTAGAVRIVSEDDSYLRGGEDYQSALAAIIPRAVWPDKPDIGTIGNAFGRWIGILRNEADRTTSISVTWYGEAFLNFGWMGLLIFLPLGAATRCYYRLTWETNSVSGPIAYLATLSAIAYIGSSVAIAINSTLKTWLVVGLVFLIASVLVPRLSNRAQR